MQHRYLQLPIPPVSSLPTSEGSPVDKACLRLGSRHLYTICQGAGVMSPPSQQQQTAYFQKQISLPSSKRGCHVMTREVLRQLPELKDFEIGLANFFIMHTSASLTLNENASSDVPLDLADDLERIVPERRDYRHLDEGMDDMPAHTKSSLMGASLTIPVSQGRLAMGTWQGIYLNEHRNYGGSRRLMVTIQGQKR
ncbi:hypothetical protein WJX74_004866 [Apatococcus lobatus]|uniref:Secondary thiamine-phosphate synthase enzyme n=1 Tax=Apatococcus lobatus TaxID=904363 RepID=A0AAW1RT38_9CHLO